MLTSRIIYFIKSSLKDEYAYRYSLFIELFSTALSLVVYYFTTQAFADSFELTKGIDYFSYVLFGEIVLEMPSYFIEGTFTRVKRGFVEGTANTLLTLSNGNYLKTVHFFILRGLPKIYLRILCLFVLGKLIFGFSINYMAMGQALILVLLYIPLYLGISYMGAGVIMMTGRGNALVGYISSILAIGAGIYFPLTVVPSEIATFFRLASPLTLILENSREFALGKTLFDLSFVSILHLIAWNSIGLMIGYTILGKGKRAKESNGIPHIRT